MCVKFVHSTALIIVPQICDQMHCGQTMADGQALLDVPVLPVSVYVTSDKGAEGCRHVEGQ